MKKVKAGVAKAFSFAHLIGMAAADGGEDPNKQRDGESDEDYAKRMDEEERKQRDDESDEDYAKRMEELDKKEGDDEEGDDADAEEETEGEKAARDRERARCAAIFSSPAAASRPDFAAHLAFQTSMKASEAIGMLTSFAAGAPKRTSLATRMAGVKQVNTGTGAGAAAPTGANAAAAMILAAGKKRRGEQ